MTTILLALALFGLTVPNGLFVYWLVADFTTVGAVLANRLALAFILDACLATGLLAYLFAVRPPGPLRWPWFVALSLLGGLGFSIPFYLWLNFRRSAGGTAGFGDWWREA
ncbi:MAG: hypothetical protein AB7O28_13800 [Vicinamibacterales bacterium]